MCDLVILDFRHTWCSDSEVLSESRARESKLAAKDDTDVDGIHVTGLERHVTENRAVSRHYTTATTPQRLHHSDYTTATTPQRLHHSDYTTATTPLRLHHSNSTTATIEYESGSEDD